MSDYVIEKGVPMKQRETGLTEALKKMEVGDSIVVRKSIRGSITSYNGRLGIKTAIRSISETEIRVWRTA